MEPSKRLEQLELINRNNERGLDRVLACVEETRTLCHSINTDGRENVERLQEQLKAAEMQQKAQNDKQMECSALQESVTLLQSTIDDLQSGVAKLSEIQEHQSQLITAELEEKDCSLEEKRRKNNLILDGIGWYEENLGFAVRPTKNNGLWLTLTKIVRTDPDQEFSFCIRHDKERNIYTLLECIPSLAGSKDLVDELNRTNNFKKFVCNMRNLFRAEHRT
ncbi:hypothetical protein GOP47_0005221 [Adiantum capillus-veneris]|uniref:Kinetochore protein SPC25 n=1 Tax=Adiantum capillus-veneris TaxID=13818 RepID=A0A9D4V5F6_ADICA|nr:hypothetical protein GOP47_0005221 [Adiantum capillus-veneris]